MKNRQAHERTVSATSAAQGEAERQAEQDLLEVEIAAVGQQLQAQTLQQLQSMQMQMTDMSVHVLAHIVAQLPWQCLLRSSAVNREWRALAEMDHVWGCQWLRTFGSRVCQRSTFDTFDRTSFRLMRSAQSAARRGQHIDMVGRWCGAGTGAGYQYGTRLQLRADASLWRESAGASFYLENRKCPPGTRTDETFRALASRMATISETPPDGIARSLSSAGWTQSIRSKSLTKLRNLGESDHVLMAGYIEWYLEGVPADTPLHCVDGGVGSGAKEFVCGAFCPKQGLLQLWGTHVDEAGNGTIGPDIYQLWMDDQSMRLHGHSRSLRSEWLAEMSVESCMLLNNLSAEVRENLQLPRLSEDDVARVEALRSQNVE